MNSGTGAPAPQDEADDEPAGTAPAADPADRARVTLGRITAHHGLNGWLKVHSDTQPRENITGYRRWSLRRDGVERHSVEVLDGRAQGKTIVARLAGIESREDAAPLIGCEIAVRRDELPPADPDEHYWADLVGLSVVRVTGGALGTVARLFETGANDVVVVRDERPDAKPDTEILIPWVRPDVIVEVDVERRVVTVDWDPDY